MLESLLATKSLIILLWLLGFSLWERICPASPWAVAEAPSGFSQKIHLLQNASLWLGSLVVSPLLLVLMTSQAVAVAPAWRLHGDVTLPWLLLDLLVLDLWIYGWHRANHRWPFLWRFHQIHHFDQQLDATSAFRFHFGEVVLSALFRAPVIILMDMPLSSIVVFETLVAMAAVFHHSNVRLPKGLENPLSTWLVTPSVHWVHHHAIRSDTDSNYGTLLVIWDRLFASLSIHQRQPDMVLGVEGKKENRITRLFLLPFLSN